MNKTLKNILLATTLFSAMTLTAQAEVGTKYDLTAGYQNNNFINKQGLYLAGSVADLNNVKLGLNTLTKVDEGKLLSYGASIGMAIPYTLPYNTNLAITPSIGVDRYRDVSMVDESSKSLDGEDFTAANIALDFNYKIDNTTFTTIQTKYSRDVDSSVDLKGPSYTFGITKLF